MHNTRILPRPRGRCEDILGRPIDQLGTPVSVIPGTEIVKIRLKPRDTVARGLDGRNTGGVVLHLLERVALGGVAGIAIVR